MSKVKPYQDPSRNTPTIRVGEAGPEEVILTDVPRYEGRWDFADPTGEVRRAAPLWVGEGERCPYRFMGSGIQCELIEHGGGVHYASRSSI